MWDKTMKRWSELDKKSIAWFLGSVLIVVVRRYFLLGLDKTYQYILMGIGFILLLNSIYRVVYQRRQIWRDVSDVSMCVERIAIRFGFYLLFVIYTGHFIKNIAELNNYDSVDFLRILDSLALLWMLCNNFLDCINLLLNTILPRKPYITSSFLVLIFYFLSLLNDFTLVELIFVVFGKLFVDMMFSENLISNIQFLKNSSGAPRKRLIRIKYRIDTLIASIVFVQIIRSILPPLFKSWFKYFLYGDNDFFNKVTLSLFMMVTAIVVFLILDIIVTDAMGELPISRYGRLYKSYSTLNKKDKRILWGGTILTLSFAFTITFSDKLREVLEKITCAFQGDPLIIGAITFLAMSILLTVLRFSLSIVVKRAVQNYKKAKTELRHYLISGAISENQEQNLS